MVFWAKNNVGIMVVLSQKYICMKTMGLPVGMYPSCNVVQLKNLKADSPARHSVAQDEWVSVQSRSCYLIERPPQNQPALKFFG